MRVHNILKKNCVIRCKRKNKVENTPILKMKKLK